MLVIQVFFGLGEAGAFPIATRSLSRWMRPTERGFAQGVTHAGSRLGAALTPLVLAGFTIFGLHWSGFIPCSAGARHFCCLDCWACCGPRSGISTIATRRKSISSVNAAERELIGSGRKRSTDIPWRKILSHQQSVDSGGDVFLLQLQSQRL